MRIGRARVAIFSDHNCFCQFVINAVSAVFYRNGTSFAPFFDYRNSLAALAAKGEEKSVKLVVLRFDFFDYIFFAFNGIPECHFNSPLLLEFWGLVSEISLS